MDLFVINSCFAISYFSRFTPQPDLNKLTPFIVAFNIVWFIVIFSLRAFEIRHVFKFSKVVKEIFQAILIHFLVIVSLVFFFEPQLLEKKYYLFVYCCVLITLPFARIMLLYVLMLYRRQGFNYVNIVFVGDDKSTMNFYRYVSEDNTLGIRVKGFFGANLKNAPENLCMGGVEDVKEFSQLNEIDRIYCASSQIDPNQLYD